MNYLLAISGGLDSSVLLKFFHDQQQLEPIKVRAIHVHHGLQQQADQWVEHCQAQCKNLGIPLIVKYVNAKANPKESPESAARNARYQAIASILEQDEVLVTAHHQNDQAETLLLHLARGAGPQGLAAMPPLKRFANGWHWRPLLSFSRQALEQFAQEHQLDWVDDPSNTDTRFDRNFLRQVIIPSFEKRWPSFINNLARAAQIQAQVCDFLDQLSAPLWQTLPKAIEALPVHPLFKITPCLPITFLNQLPDLLRTHFLRSWLKCHTQVSISQQQLDLIEREIINAASDKNPHCKIGTYLLRRYANALWLTAPQSMINTDSLFEISIGQTIITPVGRIKLDPTGPGLTLSRSKLANQKLSVRFRHQTEWFHPSFRPHSQRLKKLLQEWRIPPWERNQLPLLYAGDQLIAVAGIAVGKNYAPSQREAILYLGWQKY